MSDGSVQVGVVIDIDTAEFAEAVAFYERWLAKYFHDLYSSCQPRDPFQVVMTLD